MPFVISKYSRYRTTTQHLLTICCRRDIRGAGEALWDPQSFEINTTKSREIFNIRHPWKLRQELPRVLRLFMFQHQSSSLMALPASHVALS